MESLERTVISVSDIAIIRNDRGKERLVNCKIERGPIDTDHPPGKTTYYELQTIEDEVKIYQVRMCEAYCKKQPFTGEEGTYISFWFPIKGQAPVIGQKLHCIKL